MKLHELDTPRLRILALSAAALIVAGIASAETFVAVKGERQPQGSAAEAGSSGRSRTRTDLSPRRPRGSLGQGRPRQPDSDLAELVTDGKNNVNKARSRRRRPQLPCRRTAPAGDAVGRGKVGDWLNRALPHGRPAPTATSRPAHLLSPTPEPAQAARPAPEPPLPGHPRPPAPTPAEPPRHRRSMTVVPAAADPVASGALLRHGSPRHSAAAQARQTSRPARRSLFGDPGRGRRPR